MSFWAVWLSIVLPVFFAALVRSNRILPTGLGNFHSLFEPLGYLGCLFMALGIGIRVMAVATLKRHFTDRVSIVDAHEIVDAGIYGSLRHPAYLGVLMSLLGIGLALGNWFNLAAFVVLPFTAILYRIRVEEHVLLAHFGDTYREYMSRTKRLIPGVY